MMCALALAAVYVLALCLFAVGSRANNPEE